MIRLMQHAQLTQRRRIATLVLLLASLLEIWGCDPLRTCDPLRANRLSAMPFETLMEQCARCLAGRELTVLRHVQESPGAKDESAILHDTTVHDTTGVESLGEVQRASFSGYGEGMREGAPRSIANSTSGRGTGPIQQAKPIAWPIPESVLFLYDAPGGSSFSGKAGGRSNGKEAPRRIATGFILAVPKRHGEASMYLVTARHIVDPEWARCGVKNPPNITVRFNRLGGGVGYESIPLDAHQAPVFITAADDATDLVLIPISAVTVPHLNQYKLAETAFDALPDESELGRLSKEQQIVTVGVSGPKLAGLMDSPVSAPGVIAKDAASGAMGIRCTAQSPVKSINLWLIDASVELGVSGAPVYAALPRGPNHLPTPVLVGIQAVVWPDKGQAGVTPVAALRDLMQQERTSRGILAEKTSRR